MDQQSFCFTWEDAGTEQPFFFDGQHSEVGEALFGLLDDSHLLPFDTIFQNDIDSLMVSSSSANGEESHNSFIPSTERIHVQPPPFFQQSSFFYPPVDPTMAAAATAGVGGGCCMSAQTAAARQRRKRISEKTQELGRLIPDGMRMNTAPMLLAAFKYLKFLQAQYDILRLMESFPECKSAKNGDLHVLMASQAIQQRLSAEGMCVVPTELVDCCLD